MRNTQVVSDRATPGALTYVATLLVILLVGAFYFSTMRRGHDWGDDFALYVLHANNVAHGLDYTRTGFIYNPVYPQITWQEPPLFPLLLAPVVAVFGVNLQAMQIEVVCLFLLSLGAIFLAFRTELHPAALVGLIAVVGFNPFYWDFKEHILADFPFLLFCYVCLYVANLVYENGAREQRPWLAGALVGLSVYAAYATRAAGLALLPSVVLFDVVRFRGPTRFQTAVVATVAVCAASQALLLRDIVNYDMGFFVDPAGVVNSAPYHFSWLTSGLWSTGEPDGLTTGISLVVGILALWGFIGRLGSPGLFEYFGVLYCGLILVWDPYRPEFRYLFPLAPIYLFHAFAGLGRMQLPAWQALAPAAAMIVVAAMLANYARGYQAVSAEPLTTGVGVPESSQLFEFVKTTPKNSVFIFRKPRALTLFTERAASVYDVIQTGQDLVMYMQRIRATHLIDSEVFVQDAQILRPFIERHAESLRLVFANPQFKVYEVTTQPLSPSIGLAP